MVFLEGLLGCGMREGESGSTLAGGSAGEEVSVWQTVKRGLASAYFQKTGLNAIDAAATGWFL